MSLDPAAPLEAVKRRIKRALLNAEHVAGNLLDAFGDGPAVLGTQGESAEDEQVQGALGEFQFFNGHAIVPLLLRQEKIRQLLSKRKGKMGEARRRTCAAPKALGITFGNYLRTQLAQGTAAGIDFLAKLWIEESAAPAGSGANLFRGEAQSAAQVGAVQISAGEFHAAENGAW